MVEALELLNEHIKYYENVLHKYLVTEYCQQTYERL